MAVQCYAEIVRRSREILVSQIRNTKCLLENLTKSHYLSAEDNEIVLQFQTRSDKVRQILDLVESKGEEACEYFISILQRVPEAYYDLQPWLDAIGFQASESIQQLTVLNNDPVTLYSSKLRRELCCDSKFITSYTEKEEMLFQETYVDGVMELINQRNENMGRMKNLNSLFDENGLLNNDAETILIIGDAGMGKTLLMQKMLNLWAKGDSYRDIKFLFRFRCRMFIFLKRNTLLSLKDLIFRYNCCPDHEPEEVYTYILRFPETVLFTFDGFDEISSDFDMDSISEVPSPFDPTDPLALLKNLLHGKLLTGSRKVLTARTGCHISSNIVRKKIMLRGFSTENLQEYTTLFFKEPEFQEHVTKHLNANHSFSSLCSISLFCWIIFKSYEHFYSINGSSCFSSSSVTLTDIFLLIIEVYLNPSCKTSQRKTIRSQADLYMVNKEILLSIGKLAYDGMDESQYVFNQGETTSQDIPDNVLKLGFFKTVKEYNGLGNTSSFEFFHVTLQSFFAALYLVINEQISCADLLKYFTHCTRKEDTENINSFFSCVCAKRSNKWNPFENNDHLQFINLFLCGLLSKPKQNLLKILVSSSVLKVKRKALKQKLFKSVKSHLKGLPRRPVLGYNCVHALTHFIWMARCICETQSEKVGKLAAKGICADYIRLVYCGIYSSDCSAISFMLSHYHKKIALDLDNNNINDYGVKELIPCFSKLTVIRLYKNLITDFGAMYVAKIIEECPQLKTVKFGSNCITSEGGTSIARALQHNKNIQDIGMWGNNIGDEGAIAFAEAIKHHPGLAKLSLGCNEITDEGGQHLAAALQHNASLRIFWLTQNQLTDEAANYLAEMLTVNKTLKNLWLISNRITENGANVLSEALKHNIVLEEICLQDNPLPKEMNEPYDSRIRIT
ncbi:nucleotide-binding oligomerization domain-containing protein 1 isoform X2 [Bombina bombina]|uniref:nucleotide-binding oligomerization domain-containing protein 1 isoform X2 n=1 Tax=Bombina bombina TaxID=8345 RepID=UPI00235A4AC6|nr:nucleotide-binding oligomerization domain-containing protein 1 isoform X2 [Bombina bombina]